MTIIRLPRQTHFFTHFSTTSVFHHGSNTVNYWHRDLRHNWRCPLCPDIWCACDGQAVEGQCRVSLVAKRNTYSYMSQRDPDPRRAMRWRQQVDDGQCLCIATRVCHLCARIKFSGRCHLVGGLPILSHKIDLFVGTRHVFVHVLCSLQHNIQHNTPARTPSFTTQTTGLPML